MGQETGDDNFGQDSYGGDEGSQNFLSSIQNTFSSTGHQHTANKGANYQKMFQGKKATLQYPQDLFKGNQVNGVAFYIQHRDNSVSAEAGNVFEAGSAASSKAAQRLSSFKASREAEEFSTQTNRTSTERFDTVSDVGGTMVAAAGVMGLKKGSGVWGTIKKNLFPMATIAGGAFAAVKLDNANSIGTTFLDRVIQLHVPQSIISQYQADWNETELGMAGMLASNRFDQAGWGDASEALARGIIQAAAQVPKAIGMTADIGGALEATSRKTMNPYKEQLFKSMGFRSFAFQYVFSPKNQAEYNDVRGIINTFKYHMHPEISPQQAFLVYPSEFAIEFLHCGEDGKVTRNEHLPKISDCALKDVKVTYGPDGFFNTIKGSGGVPSEITMELSFTELEVLTSNRIADGY